MLNGRYENHGTVSWHKDDVIHREDGPAIEWADGGKQWAVNGVTHRLDGPAWERADGIKQWHVNGKLHRLDGPAIEGYDGYNKWYVEDQEVDIIAIFGYEPSVPLTDEQQMVLRLSV